MMACRRQGGLQSRILSTRAMPFEHSSKFAFARVKLRRTLDGCEVKPLEPKLRQYSRMSSAAGASASTR
eukprot:139906-Prymnesium_polylepis.1